MKTRAQRKYKKEKVKGEYMKYCNEEKYEEQMRKCCERKRLLNKEDSKK